MQRFSEIFFSDIFSTTSVIFFCLLAFITLFQLSVGYVLTECWLILYLASVLLFFSLFLFMLRFIFLNKCELDKFTLNSFAILKLKREF